MIRNLPSLIKTVLSMCLAIISFSCASNNEDECTKEINQDYVVGISGIAHYYTKTEVMPCSEATLESLPIEGTLPLLDNFEYEVLKFEFNSGTGNGSSRLYFEVELKNFNDYNVKGIPVFKMRTNINFETTYQPYLKQSCEVINAKSSCVVIVEIEEENKGNVPGPIELEEVVFALVRRDR